MQGAGATAKGLKGLRRIKGHFLAGLKRLPRRAGPQIEYSA